MSNVPRSSIQIGIVTAIIVHFVVITFISIAAFATFGGYIGAILILLPVPLIVGGSAGIILWQIQGNSKPVYVVILAMIGIVTAGIVATYVSGIVDADNRIRYILISYLAGIVGGLWAETLTVAYIFAVQSLLKRICGE